MLRRSLAQIGGPYAVTFWAWLATLPLSLLLSSTYTTTPSLQEVVAWTTALILVHAGIGVVMLLARLTVLPSRPRKPRPLTAIVVFALMGLTRAVLLQAAQHVTGFGSYDFAERLAFNVSISILAYAALAIIVGETKDDAQIVLRLEQARAAIADLQKQNQDELVDLDQRILADVEDRLRQALEDGQADPQQIRQMSETVVRLTSHELSEQLPPPRSSQPPRRLAIKDIAGRLQVPPPLAVLVPFQMSVFGFVALRYSLAIALVGTVIGPLPSLLGLWLMRRYLPLPRNSWWRVGTLVVSITALGSIAAVLVSALFTYLFGEYSASPFAVGTGLMGMSMIVSVWFSVVDGREMRREQLADALEEEARETADTAAVLNGRRLAAARFLHGTVQNELVAASLRGDSAEAVQSTIRQAFASYAGVDTSGARDELESLLRSWSTVLDVTADVDTPAWDVMATDPERGRLLVDLISEGLTNAVRHASGRSVSLQVSASDGILSVRIETEGTSHGTNATGIGLADLRSRGVDLRLESDDDHTTLIGHLN